MQIKKKYSIILNYFLFFFLSTLLPSPLDKVNKKKVNFMVKLQDNF